MINKKYLPKHAGRIKVKDIFTYNMSLLTLRKWLEFTGLCLSGALFIFVLLYFLR